jgi:hypothetical protein
MLNEVRVDPRDEGPRVGSSRTCDPPLRLRRGARADRRGCRRRSLAGAPRVTSRGSPTRLARSCARLRSERPQRPRGATSEVLRRPPIRVRREPREGSPCGSIFDLRRAWSPGFTTRPTRPRKRPVCGSSNTSIRVLREAVARPPEPPRDGGAGRGRERPRRGRRRGSSGGVAGSSRGGLRGCHKPVTKSALGPPRRHPRDATSWTPSRGLPEVRQGCLSACWRRFPETPSEVCPATSGGPLAMVSRRLPGCPSGLPPSGVVAVGENPGHDFPDALRRPRTWARVGSPRVSRGSRRNSLQGSRRTGRQPSATSSRGRVADETRPSRVPMSEQTFPGSPARRVVAMADDRALRSETARDRSWQMWQVPEEGPGGRSPNRSGDAGRARAPALDDLDRRARDTGTGAAVARGSRCLELGSCSDRRLERLDGRARGMSHLLQALFLVVEKAFSLYSGRDGELGCVSAAGAAREGCTCAQTAQPCGFDIFLYMVAAAGRRGAFLVQRSRMYKL